MPEIVAAGEPEAKLSPAGRVEPVASDHEYGAQPPPAVTLVLYAELSVAFGKGLAVAMLNDPAAIVRVRVAEALTAGVSESLAVAVTVKLPTWQVVPEMVALGVPEENARPEGSPENVQEYGDAPPVAVTVAPAPEGP